MGFVADNSVVIAWHFASQATPETTRALKRLASETAYAPAIWRLEFANVIKKAVRSKRLTEAEAFEMVGLQNSLNFFVNDAPVAIDDLLNLALRHELSAYDASYLELAIRLRLPLVTKDDALRAAARSSGVDSA